MKGHKLFLIMKKHILYLFFILVQTSFCVSQPIPYGISLDTIQVYDGYYHDGPLYQSFHLYKPLSYDPVNSPILFAMHGSGGNGTSEITDLDSIAERRKALIIAPNFPFSGFPTVIREQGADITLVDTACCRSSTVFSCVVIRSATIVFKEIYKHVLAREGLQTAPTYMIGFSAGGQFVTRYMLWRQLYPDSIPLRMAVSSNAYYYTFPTDNFLGVSMSWPCGIIPPANPIPPYCVNSGSLYNFCNDNIIQYYNENYGVLIGTGDLQPQTGSACLLAQGNNRYERALNFYNFCDSNAITRGTTLKWPYVELPGIGHDQYTMYNLKASPTDVSTIAESLLFDTPYHAVPSIAPVASFYADTTLISLNGTVHFFNTSTNAISYLWDFGDGSTSTLTNPSHIYTVVDTFIVQLTAYNGNSCSNWAEKRNYIKVVNPSGINDQQNYVSFMMQPNPFTATLTVTHTATKGTIFITDITGKEVYRTSFSKGTRQQLQLAWLQPGMYFITVSTNGVASTKKTIKL